MTTEPTTVADEIAAIPVGFREGICGNEAPSVKVGCTSMPVVCELSYGHRSEWHQGEGQHRWRRMAHRLRPGAGYTIPGLDGVWRFMSLETTDMGADGKATIQLFRVDALDGET